MVDKTKLKEIDINDCSCYYLNNLTDINDLVLKNIKIIKRSYENIVPTCYIGYKTLYNVKPL